ncbi:aromatic ring-hydroxylating dioxygenase subunit alpha [Actinomycetospora sp. OC33-EN08]|uniref:Aromatic ring-hydroxylating dioxygenase subunit alpha n=1 Tax=Actinomycetospora aurantiaca TaxID=3129233 RepID=A0ABU8MLC2_9PSEU
MTTAPSHPSLLPTLPGSAYVDPAAHAAECEHVLEASWFCAVASADLPDAGSFRTVTVGRESVLLTRSRDRQVRAFFNVCRHRGARLCTEESGTVRRSFQCPYHAWTYGLDGSLVSAPHLSSMPGLDRTAHGLRTIAVREWLGYVWVCLADDPPSFAETVEDVVGERLGSREAVHAYGIEGLSLARRITYDVAANWKLVVENFMECYHCATIHPELTEVLPEFAGGYAAQTNVGLGAVMGTEGFTVDGSAGLGRLPGVTDEQDRRYFAVTIAPQVFVNLVPDHVIVHRMFPLAVDRTVIECDWLVDPAVVAAGTDVSRSVELFDRVNRQDFDACERCQHGMSSRVYADGGVLVPTEHHIGAFHEWVRTKLGRSDPAGGLSAVPEAHEVA